MIMSAIDIVHRYSGKLDEETVRHELKATSAAARLHNIVNRCSTPRRMKSRRRE